MFKFILFVAALPFFFQQIINTPPEQPIFFLILYDLQISSGQGLPEISLEQCLHQLNTYLLPEE